MTVQWNSYCQDDRRAYLTLYEYKFKAIAFFKK